MSSVKRAVQFATAAVLIATGFAAVPSAASAAVVCNRDGDCWHTDRTYRRVVRSPSRRFAWKLSPVNAIHIETD